MTNNQVTIKNLARIEALTSAKERVFISLRQSADSKLQMILKLDTIDPEVIKECFAELIIEAYDIGKKEGKKELKRQISHL